jgi:hypothetical protein
MNNQWKSWNTERGNFSTLNRYLEFTYICTCHWKQCSLLLSSIVKLWTSQWGSNRSYTVNLWTATKGVLPAVSNIKKSIFILLLIVYGRHYCSCENRGIPFNFSKLQRLKNHWQKMSNLLKFTCRWKDIVHKYKYSLFCT